MRKNRDMFRLKLNRSIGVAAAAVAIVAGGAALTVGAHAQPRGGHRGDQCFLSSNINGFQAPNDHTVFIRVGVNDIYRLDLMNDCPGLSFRHGFGLKSTPGDPWICSPIQATVVFRETGIHNRCPVSGIHRLTPPEVAALPKRYLP
jgi:uncharacterized protein DUF6491